MQGDRDITEEPRGAAPGRSVVEAVASSGDLASANASTEQGIVAGVGEANSERRAGGDRTLTSSQAGTADALDRPTVTGPAVLPDDQDRARGGARASANATNAVAVGESASVSAASATAIGQGASASAEGAVAIGQNAVADRANTVSVGSADNQRQVTNVAAGTQATDAANVAQVQASAAEARAYADTTATQAVSSANAYTDQKFAAWGESLDTFRGDVERRFYDTDRRIDRQGAMGAAMLNMATSAAGIRTQNRVGVGVGFQGGESALSVGYQRAINDRATVTFGGALSGDEKSVGVGAGFGW